MDYYTDNKQALKDLIGDLEDGNGISVMAQEDIESELDYASKFHSLEDKLGCPLDFVLIPYFISGLKKVWYHKQWCDVVRVVAYEEATRPYMEVRCKDYKYLKMIFLDDYKNTWFLKDDKSE